MEGDARTTSSLVFDVPRAGEALVTVLGAPDFEAGDIGSEANVRCHVGDEAVRDRPRISRRSRGRPYGLHPCIHGFAR